MLNQYLINFYLFIIFMFLLVGKVFEKGVFVWIVYWCILSIRNLLVIYFVFNKYQLNIWIVINIDVYWWSGNILLYRYLVEVI